MSLALAFLGTWILGVLGGAGLMAILVIDTTDPGENADGQSGREPRDLVRLPVRRRP